MQNVIILGSTIPETSLGASKFKVGHMTWPCPFKGWFVILMLEPWHGLHACRISPLQFAIHRLALAMV